MMMKEFLEKLSAERCRDLEVRNTMDLSMIFEDGGDNIDARRLYINHFRRIPNLILIKGIDSQKAGKWIEQNHKDSITDCFFIESVQHKKESYFEDVYYFLFDDLLVHLNEHATASLYYRKTDDKLVHDLVLRIKKFKKNDFTRRKPEVKLLVKSYGGLDTRKMEVLRPKLSIEDNYNDDFLSVHQTILNRLQKKNDKGLVLLHGKPGTGKTSYIRYLITKIKKPVIFLPPNMAASITDPGLMEVLIDNPNSVFVIEDAENIIVDRNLNGASSVSALLNLADGLLSDCLNIQIICSFNTDLSRVDNALMRKGRLIAKYEFTDLNAVKAQALSNKLGFVSVITSPMTLAAVYNQNETDYAATTQRRTIGFKNAI
jgi:hypothetical protein